MLHERNGFKRAAVAVARKLAVIAHALLNCDEPFNRTVSATVWSRKFGYACPEVC
jgi:transposase